MTRRGNRDDDDFEDEADESWDADDDAGGEVGEALAGADGHGLLHLGLPAAQPPPRPRRVLLVGIDEVRAARRVEQLARDHRILTAIPAESGHLIEDIARMARAQRPLVRHVVPALQVRHHHAVEPEPSSAAVQFEDAHELVEARVLHGNLVGNPAQKGLVGE